MYIGEGEYKLFMNFAIVMPKTPPQNAREMYMGEDIKQQNNGGDTYPCRSVNMYRYRTEILWMKHCPKREN